LRLWTKICENCLEVAEGTSHVLTKHLVSIILFAFQWLMITNKNYRG